MISDIKNNLLKRREVKLVFSSAGNPGMQNSAKRIADHFKAQEERIVVKAVKGKFGRDTFLVDAFIYDSKEDKDKIEPKKKVKKEKAQ